MESTLGKVFRRTKWLWRDLYFSSKSSEYWRHQKGGAILIYHGVDHIGSLAHNTRFIGIKDLSKQLAFFKKHWQIVSLKDYLTNNYRNDRFTIAITFDDGYLNNLELALPILESYEIPASFFVTSIQSEGYDILWSDHLDLGFQFSPEQLEIDGRVFQKGKREFFEVDTNMSLKNVCRSENFEFKQKMMAAISNIFRQNPKYDMYWNLMNDTDLKRLAASPLVTIGSHGNFHNNYGEINESEVLSDLKKSKHYLEGIIDKKIEMLAYPDGSYNRNVIDIAEKMGYQFQLAVDYLHRNDINDQRIFNRFGLNPFIKLGHQAESIIRGKY